MALKVGFGDFWIFSALTGRHQRKSGGVRPLQALGRKRYTQVAGFQKKSILHLDTEICLKEGFDRNALFFGRIFLKSIKK